VGPALVGWISLITDSQRLGMTVIFGFWLLGLILIWGLQPGPPKQSADDRQAVS
jgi:MFS-type transporter involved in bile tolerance (Atg22 family)